MKKCKTCAKSVRPVQITHRNPGLWLAERQWEISKPMILSKTMTKVAPRKIFPQFLRANLKLHSLKRLV